MQDNSTLSRRGFLGTSAAAGTALALGCTGGDTLQTRHWNAKWRTRRIIMNNDGNDVITTGSDKPITIENFLANRTSPLLGSHVDSIFYCTGVFNLYAHDTKIGEFHDDTTRHQRMSAELIEKYGKDCLDIMVEYCHEHDIECFWSMRMNDNHDAAYPTLMTDWKREHPEYLVAKEGDELPYVRGKWSMLDYTVPEVRERAFRIIAEVVENYDVDGIEMDFFRHPAYFKPQFYGEPVTDEHREMMTEFVTRVRSMMYGVERRRDRPLLLSVRIPDSYGYASAIGLDLERWLELGLIDLVAGAGYFHLEPWENLKQKGEEYKVPVYSVFVQRRIMLGGEPESDTQIERWRGEAYNAWQAGVDGIYTFNRFDPHDPLFRELGDPELLAGLDRIDQQNYHGDGGYLDPSYWLKDGRSYVVK